MIVLGFDTATAATAVALLRSDAPADASRQATPVGSASAAPGARPEHAPDPASGATERRHDPAAGERPGHAAHVLTLAHELLREAGLTFADVDRIAVGLGPGGFTGLRIGVATARALAQAARAELVGVSTLEALARAAEPDCDPGQGVLAVVDARRGEVFVAGWRDGEQVLAQRAVAPAQAGALGVAGWLAVGDGALRFRRELQAAGCKVPKDASPRHGVSARMVCRLALQAPRGSERDLVVPDYLRKPDAVRSKP